MEKKFFHGCYPTMITPFNSNNKIDYSAVERLVEWYISKGSHGIFAVCQSSEMFFLTEQEKIDLARAVLDFADGRIRIIASGHTADNIDEQVDQLGKMGELGLDAVVMVSNRLAKEIDDDESFIKNFDYIVSQLPTVKFGIYECPYPYLKLLSTDFLKKVVEEGNLHFLKDVSCSIDIIKDRIEIIQGSNLSLFNANTATLLDSLIAGADGYNGVMANFHIDIYRWLYDNYETYPALSRNISDFLTLAAISEIRAYPVNAKLHKKLTGVEMNLFSRVRKIDCINENAHREIESLIRLEEVVREKIRM